MRYVIPSVLAATLVVACGGRSAPAIVIEGSSTLHPITAEAVKQFQYRSGEQPFNLRESSTGAGPAKFCAGELDVADASRPIAAERRRPARKEASASSK